MHEVKYVIASNVTSQIFNESYSKLWNVSIDLLLQLNEQIQQSETIVAFRKDGISFDKKKVTLLWKAVRFASRADEDYLHRI